MRSGVVCVSCVMIVEVCVSVVVCVGLWAIGRGIPSAVHIAKNGVIAFGKIRPMYWPKLFCHAPSLLPSLHQLCEETAVTYTPQQVDILMDNLETVASALCWHSIFSDFDFFT